MSHAFASMLEAIYGLTGSYGWAIILFTLLIKLLLTPLDYKSRKSMKQMERLQPQMLALQQKYANDREKLSQKTMQLYQESGVNPSSGCLPTLLSMAILFVMFSAMRTVADKQMAHQVLVYLADGSFECESFLWVKNLWMPDSPFSPAMPASRHLSAISAANWQAAYAMLRPEQLAALPSGIAFDFAGDACRQTVEAIAAYMNAQPAYLAAVETVPNLTNINLLIMNLSVYVRRNGYFLLPLLSSATQILMTRLSAPKKKDAPQPKAPSADGKDEQAAMQAAQGKLMTWGMPIFSLIICLDYSSAFALYWVASNLFAMAQTVILNRIFSRDGNVENAVQAS